MVTLSQIFNKTYPNEVQTFTGITSELATATSEDIDISANKALLITSIESDIDATVRLYPSQADRTNELNFQEFTLMGGTPQTFYQDAIAFVNQENLIFARVTNNSAGNSAIAIALTGLPWVANSSETANVGAGAILLPLNQSLFEATDNTLITAYTPEVGTNTWSDIKVLDTANTPNNQIINNQLEIAEDNTGAVIDFGISDTVLRVNWAVESGAKLGVILRYESDGNMLLLELDQATNTVSLNSVVASTITLIASTFYPLNAGNDLKIEIRIIGVAIALLVEGVLLKEFYTALYKDNTSFGVARVD